MDNNTILVTIIALFGAGIGIYIYKLVFPAPVSKENKVVNATEKERAADTQKVADKVMEVAAMDEDIHKKMEEVKTAEAEVKSGISEIKTILDNVASRKDMSEEEIKKEYESHGFKVEDF